MTLKSATEKHRFSEYINIYFLSFLESVKSIKELPTNTQIDKKITERCSYIKVVLSHEQTNKLYN